MENAKLRETLLIAICILSLFFNFASFTQLSRTNKLEKENKKMSKELKTTRKNVGTLTDDGGETIGPLEYDVPLSGDNAWYHYSADDWYTSDGGEEIVTGRCYREYSRMSEFYITRQDKKIWESSKVDAVMLYDYKAYKSDTIENKQVIGYNNGPANEVKQKVSYELYRKGNDILAFAEIEGQYVTIDYHTLCNEEDCEENVKDNVETIINSLWWDEDMAEETK